MGIFQEPTISELADFLECQAHLMGINYISVSEMEKYYIYDSFNSRRGNTDSYGFTVFYKLNKRQYIPVGIERRSPEEIQLIVDNIGLQFGD